MTIRDLIEKTRAGIPVRHQGESLLPSLAAMQQEMNRLFEHLYNGMHVHMTDWDTAALGSLAVNIAEDETAFRLEAGLPGIAPEAVDVSVTDGFITIKGESKDSRERKDDGYVRRETSHSSFYRQIALPASADARKAEASYKDGLLTVVIPKKADAVQNPQKLDIKKVA